MKMPILYGVMIVAAALLCLPSTEATTYTVGDALNWVDPPTSTTYSIWASSHVFVKGDVLVFNFNTGIHDVAEVTKEAYKKCNTSSPISIHVQSPVRISLPKRGSMYFISTLNNDCESDQKMAIQVLNNLPPSPPSGLPLASAPSPAPGLNDAASPLPATIPNGVATTPPPPVQNLARSSLGTASCFNAIVSIVVVLVCQYTL